jgi:hypothetical protein
MDCNGQKERTWNILNDPAQKAYVDWVCRSLAVTSNTLAAQPPLTVDLFTQYEIMLYEPKYISARYILFPHFLSK